MRPIINSTGELSIALIYINSDYDRLVAKREELGLKNKICYNSRCYKFTVKKKDTVFSILLTMLDDPIARDALEYLYQREVKRSQGLIAKHKLPKINKESLNRWRELRNGEKS